MTSRERFEAYCASKGLLPRVNGNLFEAWQAAERQALERAARICDENIDPAEAAYEIRALVEGADGETCARDDMPTQQRQESNGQPFSTDSRTPGWISVKDRLPDSVGTYLLYRPEAHVNPACDPNVTVRRYHGGGEFGGAHEVTHWMPLPEAPASSVASKEEPTS